MVNSAIIMCGGESKHYESKCKALVKYGERTMISYILESLLDTKIKRIILISNETNCLRIEEETKNYPGKDYLILKRPPKRFREFVLHIKDLIDNDPFLVLAGNQPMKKEFLEKILSIYEKERCWVLTLYDKNISNENSLVNLRENNFITKGDSYVIQHPFIISKEILKYQELENYEYKIEETIKNISEKINIKGILSEMPPEFDDLNMFKNTENYLKLLNEEIILIPGNSVSNKDWIENLNVKLKSIFPNTKIYYYKHWSENEIFINFQYEFDRLKEEIKKNKVILAKSVGIILCLKLIKEGLIKPEKCIFLGFPLNWAKKNNFNFEEWIKDYKIKTLFIQNDCDPFCNFDELRNLLEKNNVKNYELVKSIGETHDYEDYCFIREKISNFL